MGEPKRLKINALDDSLETLEKRSGCPTSPISISKATEIFHKNIRVGPEYICTCCDQLWYRSSVTECNASLYQSCSRKILNCVRRRRTLPNRDVMARCQVKSRFGYVAFASLWCYGVCIINSQ